MPKVPRFSERCVGGERERMGKIVDEAWHCLRRSSRSAGRFNL